VPRRTQLYSRHLAPRLRESLTDTPAVLIHGPRQSGKTTLARTVGEPRGYRYVSFDDEAIRSAAQNDPIGFVAGLPKRAILDEVQRVPEIFTSLKASIDRERSAGRFILTGSANVLLIPKLADSLAGRMGLLRLHPLALARRKPARRRMVPFLC
jgi:predicted AAA+ superfamily ATPase